MVVKFARYIVFCVFITAFIFCAMFLFFPGYPTGKVVFSLLWSLCFWLLAFPAEAIPALKNRFKNETEADDYFFRAAASLAVLISFPFLVLIIDSRIIEKSIAGLLHKYGLLEPALRFFGG